MSSLAAASLESLPLESGAREFLKTPHHMIIGGKDAGAVSGRTLDVFDPASGAVIGVVPAGAAADIDAAVSAARAALEKGPWSKLRPADRERLILKLADLVEANAEAFAQIETLNNGQSINISRALESGASIEHLRYMAGWATKIEGATLDVSIPIPPGQKYRVMTRKEPVGVVGAIIPWNFPLLMAVWKIAPALAAGCTVVLKPAEETPLTALKLGQLCREAGIPDGVVNVVTGYGHEAGAALAAHPGIDKLAFTGSTEVGKLIGHAAVDNMTRFTLELGGKSPMVMFDDMNPALVGLAANIGTFFNQGQVCTCGSRLLVQKSIFDKVVGEFVGAANAVTIGSGFDPQNQINPLVSAKQQSRVLGMIETSVGQGAKIAAGGERHGEKGYFVKPTVIVDADASNIIVRDEVFGPVVVAIPFDDLDDAVAKANDTPYGLAASVWSQDVSKIMNFADAVKAGTVWVNCHNLVDPNMPFGGYKDSGLGREHGRAGIENYLETKSICIAV